MEQTDGQSMGGVLYADTHVWHSLGQEASIGVDGYTIGIHLEKEIELKNSSKR